MNRMRALAGLVAFSSLLFFSCSDDTSSEPEQPEVPQVSTVYVCALTQTTAECGGTITSDGGAAVSACGVCWSTGPTPTVHDGKTIEDAGQDTYVSVMVGLSPGTSYYVRAYATNSAGTGYGDAVPFTTAPSSGTVIDYDGNAYHTVTIGTQVWMAENLKVTHYRNGDPIPEVTGDAAWQSLSTGAYCEYDNDAYNAAVYGRLYNWYAVADGRGLAPTGWHVANDAEWQTLCDYLGGDMVAGGKMKEPCTTHWRTPNVGATNESGLSVLPGGQRNWDGDWLNVGANAYFWTSTEDNGTDAWYRSLYWDNPGVARDNYLKRDGFSIRCVKD